MSFTEEYISTYDSIISKATEAGSPYSLTKQFIEDEVLSFNITEREKAELMVNLMAQVTIGITQQAMIIALQVKVASEKTSAEIASVEAQTALFMSQKAVADKQALDVEAQTIYRNAQRTEMLQTEEQKRAVMTADVAYKNQQRTSLEESVEDNRKIKFLDANGNMIGVLGAGGLVPPTKLFENFFQVSNDLLTMSLSVTDTDYEIKTTT